MPNRFQYSVLAAAGLYVLLIFLTKKAHPPKEPSIRIPGHTPAYRRRLVAVGDLHGGEFPGGEVSRKRTS